MARDAAKWLTPESLTLLRGMACMGKDASQIAACMGISLSTLRRWQKRYPEIAQALAFDKEGADLAKIENEIKTMPNYFADYDTTVHFITKEELDRDHAGIPHGGFVIRSGKTGLNLENRHIIEYKLRLDSNPEFTSSVLLAYARAAYKLNESGSIGCKTVLDIPPAMLSQKSGLELAQYI